MRRIMVSIFLATALAGGADRVSAQDSGTRDEVGLAVLPLPASLQASATVLGYAGSDELHTIREGEGPFVCLADDPNRDGFHVACYHRSLEPYMARGRELRAAGLGGRENLSKRWEEIDAGTLEMPRHPTFLYQLFAQAPPAGDEDLEGMGRLTVIYVPYATAEELGLSAEPEQSVPWMMFPGKPTAHVMIRG
ncbi:MAG: hypothetical protein ACE5HQ_06860 [Gemmatimonadota bacterium]